MVVNKFNTIRKNIGAFMVQIPGKIALTADMWMKKTLALTTDNESAMIVCGRTFGQQLITQLDSQNFRHYRCTAHIHLNLAAQQELEMISDEVIKV
ncbi:hypothetical protein RIR_g31287.t4 [Rhizophagus irregularis DAOM 181602=DAOM 197198]|uniref:Uncharacterized protein n=1 Tax=Rhizophagus irregularis (strain DAOM 197198w) TaxID=1432141 RepID=A0A015I991_RHIIW|nr:hypothetical protein RirG_240970 [Rhizophagus irregularis DAOM 197198w]GET56965.1 hypothetical protein RIR_g31287.t4 [Rhizophagus irregularis DAOM 181602=DAOM 197198]